MFQIQTIIRLFDLTTYANPTGQSVECTNRFYHSVLVIFPTLYKGLVCHVEYFSVELDTLHKNMTMTKALQQTSIYFVLTIKIKI